MVTFGDYVGSMNSNNVAKNMEKESGERPIDDLRLHPQENLTELTQDISVCGGRGANKHCADACTGSDGATDDE